MFILLYQFQIKENPITKMLYHPFGDAWLLKHLTKNAQQKHNTCTSLGKFNTDKKLKSIATDVDDLGLLLIRLEISIAR